MRNKLLIASVVVVVIHVICLYKAASTQDHYWFYAMFAILATGLITFFGILLQNLEVDDRKVSDQSMRLAIAGLISSAYITLLAYTVFVPEGTRLAKIAEDLVTNFTAIVGTVIAFYFGSTAYIESRRPTRDSNNEN